MPQSDAEHIDPPDSDQDVVPTLEQLAHHVQQLRSDERRWHVQRAASLHRLCDAVLALGEAQAHLKADLDRLADQLVLARAALGDLAEGQGRILAELAARARQDSMHEEAITGMHKALDVTRKDLAIARAKWLGWRSLAAGIGWGALEALKHWIGG